MASLPASIRWLTTNVFLRFAIAFVGLYALIYFILHISGAPTRVASVNGLSVLFMAMPAWGLSIVASRYARYGYALYFVWALIWVVDFAAVSFTIARYGLALESPVVVEAVSNANINETTEYLGETLPLLIPMMFLVPAIAYLFMRLMRGFGRQLEKLSMPRWTAIVVGLTLIILPLAYHSNNVVARADPVTRWAKFYKDLRAQEAARVELVAARGEAVKKVDSWEPRYAGPQEKTVVFVIGESSNKSDWSLFGYERKTTPLLEAMRDRLVLFPDTVSSFGSTIVEVTRLLTGASHSIGGKWKTEPDVILLAKAAGYKVFWLSNQNDFYLNTVFGKEADYFKLVNHGLGQRSDTSIDENLLPEVDKALGDPAKLKFIIIHSIGSHQHYSLRYPPAFAKFDNVDDAVSKAMAEKWGKLRDARNTYDNTILYTDFFLSSVIGQLDKVSNPNAEMLYVSDHAQDVGHFTSMWGHQFKFESGFTVPMFLWTKSDAALLANKQALENRPYQTDELDWTLLSMLGVKTRYDMPQFNLLGPNFKPWERIIDKRPYIPGRSHIAEPAGG
ncbi:sulfatase-like hydrolase/transferase [Rhizobium sp. KVB221]|uniref:Sulfatase-like hydrolase/transferase n=1 Tax=Rhizobium setariae TaxID=2801340 RepID=A0A936YKE3_9HYPH|nr:phosphoethanolamine transferase [Rhizobium setariae]MBL0371935.1 sulfatase-like hydrolase/transferase [Rhizobium setariae]